MGLDDLAILAQRPLFEPTRGVILFFLTAAIAILLCYLAAVFVLWLLMRHLSSRAALIVLGIAIGLHLVTLAVYLIANPQVWNYPGVGLEILEALAMPLWLTIPLVVFSLLRLRRN